MSTTSVLLNISKSNRDKEGNFIPAVTPHYYFYHSILLVPFISVVLSSTIPLLGVITLAIITGFGIYIKIRHSPNKLKNKGTVTICCIKWQY